MPHEVGRPGSLELLQFGPVASIASARQKTPLRAETCDKSAIPRA